MADYINKIRTTEGDKPVNYEALANKPNSLPNPNKIKFTGSVVAEYNGSSEVTVNIPNGASEEQAAQIQTNTNDISELKNKTSELKSDINNITEEITIPGWYKIGYYSGEKHNTTNGVSLFFEIPKQVTQIRVVANGRAYFNDYTFINEDDNIVSYGTKLTQDKDIDVLIDVPDGATKVVVGGKIEDCDSTSVFYKATVKKETEAYIKRLIGKRSKIFFTVGVRSEGTVDNSIYYDVSNAISITVNGTFEQRKDIATFIDNNGVLVGSVSATVTGNTEKTISVPKKAKTVYISTTYQNLNSAVVFGKYEIEQSNLKGKKSCGLELLFLLVEKMELKLQIVTLFTSGKCWMPLYTMKQ